LAVRANERPDIADLKRRALDALNRLDLENANRLFEEIRNLQKIETEQRRRTSDEARRDLLASLEEEANTCARQASVALLELNVQGAVGKYREGIAMLAEASTEIRWKYAITAADMLRELGDRAGRNDALSAAISIYERALVDAPDRRRPLDRAR